VSEDDTYDEELRLAMQMSLVESGVVSGGRSPTPSVPVSTKPSPYFGPARETSDYREGQWGMVLSEKSQEMGVVGTDNKDRWSTGGNYDLGEEEWAVAHERKRTEGVPVVVDTRTSGNGWGNEGVSRLAGLLTIFHKIPKTRDALLLSSPREPGAVEFPGEGWWKGTHTLPAPMDEEESDTTGEAVLREAARIMAFLDDTDRAYGRHASPHSAL